MYYVTNSCAKDGFAHAWNNDLHRSPPMEIYHLKFTIGLFWVQWKLCDSFKHKILFLLRNIWATARAQTTLKYRSDKKGKNSNAVSRTGERSFQCWLWPLRKYQLLYFLGKMFESQEEQNEMYLHKLCMQNIQFQKKLHLSSISGHFSL